MTREEAIKELEILKEDYWDDDGYGHETKQYDDTMLALDMAIEALGQQPCDNAISRQAVLDLTGKSDWFESSDDYNDFVIAVCELPPVTPQMEKIRVANIDFDEEKFKKIIKNAPIMVLDDSNTPTIQPKTGRWISFGTKGEIDGQIVQAFTCSECCAISVFRMASGNIVNGDLCPNCGAKMEVEEWT